MLWILVLLFSLGCCWCCVLKSYVLGVVVICVCLELWSLLGGMVYCLVWLVLLLWLVLYSWWFVKWLVWLVENSWWLWIVLVVCWIGLLWSWLGFDLNLRWRRRCLWVGWRLSSLGWSCVWILGIVVWVVDVKSVRWCGLGLLGWWCWYFVLGEWG